MMPAQDRICDISTQPALKPLRNRSVMAPSSRVQEGGALYLSSFSSSQRVNSSSEWLQQQQQQQLQPWSSSSLTLPAQHASPTCLAALATPLPRAYSCSHLQAPCLSNSSASNSHARSRRHSTPPSLTPFFLTLPHRHPRTTPCSSGYHKTHPTEIMLPNSPDPSPSPPEWGSRSVPAWPASGLHPTSHPQRPLQGSNSCQLHASSPSHNAPKLRVSFPRSSKVSPAPPPNHALAAAFARRCKQVSLPGCSHPAPPPPVEPLHAWLPPPSPRTTPRSVSDQKPPLPPKLHPRRPGSQSQRCSKETALDPSLLIASRQHATLVRGGEQLQLLTALGLTPRHLSRTMPSLARRTPAMTDLPPIDLGPFAKASAVPDDMRVAQRTPAMSDLPSMDLSPYAKGSAVPEDMRVAQRTPAMADLPAVARRLGVQGSASLPASLPEPQDEAMRVAQRTPGVLDMLAGAGAGAYLDLHTASIRGRSAPEGHGAQAQCKDLANAQVCSRTAAVADLSHEPGSSVSAFSAGTVLRHGRGRGRGRPHDRHPLPVFPGLPTSAAAAASARASSPGTSSNRSSNTSSASVDAGKAVRGAMAQAPGKILEDGGDGGELTLVSRAPSVQAAAAATAAAAGGVAGVGRSPGGGCCSGWLHALLGGPGGGAARQGSFTRLAQERGGGAAAAAAAAAAPEGPAWQLPRGCFLCAWTPARSPQLTRASYAPTPRQPAPRQPSSGPAEENEPQQPGAACSQERQEPQEPQQSGAACSQEPAPHASALTAPS